MHIHILGICGTFMGSLAVLAKSLGYMVTGSDSNVYPPMSTQLEQQGIELMQGYQAAHLQPAPDLVVIGNAMSRGNAAVEYVLNQGLAYTSGPQWLAEHVLAGKHVLAIAGTHGKTTASSMLAWIFESAGIDCGYLIGGVPKNFDVSARLGTTDYFVVEADEYDSAFFDKRSKFIHYRPRTLVINNLEFDHADIFDNIGAIQKQFHHVIRTVPSDGSVIYPDNIPAIDDVIAQGCWSKQITLAIEQDKKSTHSSGGYTAELLNDDGSAFAVYQQTLQQSLSLGEVHWGLLGQHNVQNALAASAAAMQAGLSAKQVIAGLASFQGVKRRLEKIAEPAGVCIYDDFAHHPTAIATTLQGMRAQQLRNQSQAKIIAVIEPRSNTMQLGVHQNTLLASVEQADQVFWFQPQALQWDLDSVVGHDIKSQVFSDIQSLVLAVTENVHAGDQVVIMSNGGFAGLHQQLIDAINKAHE